MLYHLFFTLAYFVLLKVSYIVFYFISSLLKRKSIYNLTQESIKISKIFKEGGLQEKF